MLADVVGTLVTEDKVLTKRAQAAVRRLRDVGIRFAITSGRPPRGMAMLFDALQLNTPIAGFNGGLFVKRDFSIIEQKTLPADVAAKAIELIREHGLDAWIYRGNDWLITKSDAPHVAREAWTVKFQPKVVADFAGKLNDVAKIVGVSGPLSGVALGRVDSEDALRLAAVRTALVASGKTSRAIADGGAPSRLSADVTCNAEAVNREIRDQLTELGNRAGLQNRAPSKKAGL